MSESRYASAGRNQFESARKSGALAAIYLDEDDKVTVKALTGKLGEAQVFGEDAKALLNGGPAVEKLRAFIAGLRPPPRG